MTDDPVSQIHGYHVCLRRSHEGPDAPWLPIATVRTAGGVEDELRSWSGPRLYHGDVVRVIAPDGRDRALGVWDGDRSSLARIRKEPPVGFGSWATFWEGSPGPVRMLEYVVENRIGVDHRRIVLAAWGCVGDVLRFVPQSHRSSRVAVESIESWALGGPRPDLRVDPLDDQSDSARSAVQAAMYLSFAAVATAYAVTSVAHAVGAAQSSIAGGEEMIRSMSLSVIDRIPLSVFLCAMRSMRDPLPIVSPRGGSSAQTRGRSR